MKAQVLIRVGQTLIEHRCHDVLELSQLGSGLCGLSSRGEVPDLDDEEILTSIVQLGDYPGRAQRTGSTQGRGITGRLFRTISITKGPHLEGEFTRHSSSWL